MTQHFTQASEDYSASVVSGVYVIQTIPKPYNRALYTISLQGPAGSSLQIFLNGSFFDNTPRGDLNTANYFGNRQIPKNAVLKLVWSVGTGTPVPSASIYTQRL